MVVVNDESAVGPVHRVRDTERKLRDYLNDLGRKWSRWLLPNDPVRTKNLEKVAGYLQSMLIYLDSHDGSPADAERSESLVSLLDQIKTPGELSSNNAWELADLFEVELIRVGDDAYIYMLLKAQPNLDGDAHTWDKHFSVDDLKRLQENYSDGKFRDDYALLEARRFLEYLQQARIAEYRRDRAKVQLRGKYLGRMVLLLATLLFGLCYFFIAASQPGGDLLDFNLLPLVLLAGAVGSVLSRAIKLGKQPLHAATDAKVSAPPLGIRALMSGWNVFLAQPVIGATAALILYMVFQTGLVQIGGSKELEPAAYGLLGFLAGFSEPFFIGILDKVAGQAGGSLD